MGFLEGLRQQREQTIQSELSAREQYRKEEEEEAKRRAVAVDDSSRAFLKEAGTVVQLLDRLSEFGYVDYLHKIAAHSEIYRSSVLFMRHHLSYYYYPENDNKPKPWVCTQDPELAQQELIMRQDLAGKIEDTSLFNMYRIADGCLREHDSIYRGNLKYREYMDPNTQFFGDQLTSRPAGKQSGFWARLSGSQPLFSSQPQPSQTFKFTEPREVGIGFRFSKMIEESKKSRLEGLDGNYDPMGRSFIQWIATTSQYSAFYVRIRTPHHAVITGATFRKK